MGHVTQSPNEIEEVMKEKEKKTMHIKHKAHTKQGKWKADFESGLFKQFQA